VQTGIQGLNSLVWFLVTHTYTEIIDLLFFKCLFFKKIYLFLWVSRDRVSLCNRGCPGTHSVDQAGLELRDPPASASWVLGLKACATMPSIIYLCVWVFDCKCVCAPCAWPVPVDDTEKVRSPRTGFIAATDVGTGNSRVTSSLLVNVFLSFVHVLQQVYGGQRTPWSSWFSPCTMRVQGKLRSPGLVASTCWAILLALSFHFSMQYLQWTQRSSVWWGNILPLIYNPSIPNPFKERLKPGVVAHAFNPSTREAEAGGFLSSRPARSTKWVPGQSWLYRETLSRKTKIKKKKKKFKSQRKRSDALKWKLQMAMSHHIGAGNQIHVLCNSSRAIWAISAGL
jgi:hypothetical protein